MELKDIWKDLEDGKSEINVDDINLIAQYTIKNETALSKKVEKENGKGLSSNDFTDEYKEKLENTKNADYNQNDETASDYIKNRPFYERLETLVTQKPIIGGEDDFASTDCLWEDTSLRLKDKDIIVFHITDTASGKEDYIEAPLYYTEDSYWGKKGFDTNLDDAWFGYNGIVDENNLYIGVRLVVPQLFNGTVEISRIVVKQLDEKFIPDSIARTNDVIYTYVTDKKLGENKSEDDMGIAFVNCSEEIKVGDTIKVKGYFEDGTTEEYTLTVPETYIAGEFITIGSAGGRLGEITMPVPTVVIFGCEIKGEVYKMNKVLISDAVTEIDSALNNIIEKYGLDGDA